MKRYAIGLAIFTILFVGYCVWLNNRVDAIEMQYYTAKQLKETSQK
jgi:cbb3-type cytochrome oxidase subunit 3